MSVSLRHALAVLLALAGPGLGLGACSASTELRRVKTPREGVALAYALPPGQGFEGTVRLGNTRAVEGLEDPLSQTITCDVSMVILGPGPTGTEVRATFTSVDLDWDLPPAATYSTDELIELAQTQLRGMQVTFVVRPDGRVQALPAPPSDAPPELREVIETMLMGLEAFFVPLPPEPLDRGEAWSQSLSHTTADGLRRAVEHQVQLEGSYAHRTEDVVLRRLSIEQERHEQRPSEGGPVTVEQEIRAQLMFADAGYPAELDRETREADPEHGVVFRKVRAQWTRARGLVPEKVAPVTGDVQVIRDPCNPDYVGPLSCEEPSATEDREPAPDDDAGAPGPDDAAGAPEDDDASSEPGPDDAAGAPAPDDASSEPAAAGPDDASDDDG